MPRSTVSPASRRNFLRLAGLAASAPILTEAHFAYAAMQQATGQQQSGLDQAERPHRMHASMDAVLINANENPLGPCEAARKVIADMAAVGGRYDLLGVNDKLVRTFSQQSGLDPKYIAVYAGSSEPLHYSVLAFTSPTKGLVIADPSYEAPMRAANVAGAKISRVALTPTYAHDVKAMVAAEPNAGVLYICNPNNPTGTMTPREEIVWALDNKPKGSILLVDEAYIHLSGDRDIVDLVKADKDLIILRTFSKIYGMAGIRCGFALGRPDLLAKLRPYGMNPMPVTGTGAANVSLEDAELIPKRRAIIADTRTQTLGWLKENHFKVIGDSKSNCFMIDTGRDGRGVQAAMAKQNVMIGRVWPVWPNAVRISVGTPQEMAKFQTAWASVMAMDPVRTNAMAGELPLHDPLRVRG